MSIKTMRDYRAAVRVAADDHKRATAAARRAYEQAVRQFQAELQNARDAALAKDKTNEKS